VDGKEQVRLLVRALNHLRDQYEALYALCEAFDRQEDERLLQWWGRRWERERRSLRFLEARNEPAVCARRWRGAQRAARCYEPMWSRRVTVRPCRW
jgi:hypothetical protein